jgi:hypothetical protein
MSLVDVITLTLVVVLVAITLAVPLGLAILGVRHLRGSRTRFDRLFEGIGRANAMSSHLRAGTPHPDDLAVPLPERPRRRRR